MACGTTLTLNQAPSLFLFTQRGCPNGVRTGYNIPCHLQLPFPRKCSCRDMTATQGCGTIRLHSMDYSTFSVDYAAYFLPPGNGFLPTVSSWHPRIPLLHLILRRSPKDLSVPPNHLRGDCSLAGVGTLKPCCRPHRWSSLRLMNQVRKFQVVSLGNMQGSWRTGWYTLLDCMSMFLTFFGHIHLEGFDCGPFGQYWVTI